MREVAEVVLALQEALRARPTYQVLEAPTSDPLTGERVLFVTDLDENRTALGKVQLSVRWVSLRPATHGYLQVRLSDPLRSIPSRVWRKFPSPIDHIVATTDDWLLQIRATLDHRRALEAAEAALHARLGVLSARLGGKSLKVHRLEPGRAICDVILRPRDAAACDRVFTLLTTEEQDRARPAFWIRLDRVPVERLEALVEAADAHLKVPLATPYRAPRSKRSRAR